MEKSIYFLGVDALPGEGIDAIQQGKLAASYIYPTHGEEIIALALKILEHKPFKRTNIISSVVVTPQNVRSSRTITLSLFRISLKTILDSITSSVRCLSCRS